MDDNKFYFYAKLIIAGLTIVMIFSISCLILRKREKPVIVTIPVNNMDYITDDALIPGDWLLLDSIPRYLIYINSKTCTDCALKDIIAWRKDINMLKNKIGKCHFTLILFHDNQNLDLITNTLYAGRFPFPYFIDSKNVFTERNPWFKDAEHPVYALLNENKEVCLMGNPIRDKHLWRRYTKLIESY